MWLGVLPSTFALPCGCECIAMTCCLKEDVSVEESKELLDFDKESGNEKKCHSSWKTSLFWSWEFTDTQFQMLVKNWTRQCLLRSNLNIFFFGRETRFENIGLVLQEILTVICSLSNQEPILNKTFGIQIDHKNDFIEFKNTLYIRVRELIERGTCWRRSKIKLKKSLFCIFCAKYQRKIESFWFEKLLYIITRFQIRILNIRTR